MICSSDFMQLQHLGEHLSKHGSDVTLIRLGISKIVIKLLSSQWKNQHCVLRQLMVYGGYKLRLSSASRPER